VETAEHDGAHAVRLALVVLQQGPALEQVEGVHALEAHKDSERAPECLRARARGLRGGALLLFLRAQGRRLRRGRIRRGGGLLARELGQHAAELEEGLLALGAARLLALELALETRDLLLERRLGRRGRAEAGEPARVVAALARGREVGRGARYLPLEHAARPLTRHAAPPPHPPRAPR